MTALTQVVAIVLVLVLLAIVTRSSTDRRATHLLDRRASDLDSRSQDLGLHAERLEERFHLLESALRAAYAVDAHRLDKVIDALISDRQVLIRAYLAASNPQSAIVAGRVEHAIGGTVERPGRADMRQFLLETLPERDTETMTSDGESIVPVGWATA